MCAHREAIPSRFMTYGLCLFLMVVACVAAIYLSIKYSSIGNSAEPSGLWYSPNDSHLVPVSGTFCNKLYVWADNGAEDYNISLFMLSSRPRLTENDFISISRQITFYSSDNGYYKVYYYYLYQGSKVNMSACYQDEGGHGVFFYLIKGNSTYHHVKEQFPNIETGQSEGWFQVDYQCNNGRNCVMYTVTKSDFYYFLFYHQKESVASKFLNISLALNCTKYVPSKDSMSKECISRSVDDKSCSVAVPLSGRYVLLVLKPNEWNKGVNWVRDKELLSTKCDPRIWMYIVLAFAVSLGIVLGLLVAIFVCIAATKYHKKRVHYPAIQRDHSAPEDSLPNETSKLFLEKPNASSSPDYHKKAMSYQPARSEHWLEDSTPSYLRTSNSFAVNYSPNK